MAHEELIESLHRTMALTEKSVKRDVRGVKQSVDHLNKFMAQTDKVIGAGVALGSLKMPLDGDPRKWGAQVTNLANAWRSAMGPAYGAFADYREAVYAYSDDWGYNAKAMAKESGVSDGSTLFARPKDLQAHAGVRGSIAKDANLTIDSGMQANLANLAERAAWIKKRIGSQKLIPEVDKQTGRVRDMLHPQPSDVAGDEARLGETFVVPLIHLSMQFRDAVSVAMFRRVNGTINEYGRYLMAMEAVWFAGTDKGANAQARLDMDAAKAAKKSKTESRHGIHTLVEEIMAQHGDGGSVSSAERARLVQEEYKRLTESGAESDLYRSWIGSAPWKSDPDCSGIAAGYTTLT
jgi:hypothetical protein